jgi:MFS transporter, DHA2 family, methylenomycin A resistance protein
MAGVREAPGRGWALLATSLGFAVVQLDVSVVNVAIQPIGADLGGSVTGLQWVVNAYTVAFAALILSAGALGDRIGARRVFVAGFAVFTLASAACGLAPTLPALIAARAVQGSGAAVLVPCSLSLLTHMYPDPAGRARAVGLWAAGAAAALSAGPLVGGLLTAALGWRSVFFVNAPIGLAGILLTYRYAFETSRSRSRGLDLPGQLAAVVALVALAVAVVDGGRDGFGTAPVLLGFGLAGLAAGAFLLVESRRSSPMLPLGLFRPGTFSASTAIGLTVNAAFYGLIFLLSLYFQRDRGWSVLATGLAFAPTTAAVLVGNLAARRLTAAVGTRRTLVGAAVVLAGSLAGLVAVGADTPYAVLVGPLAVAGFALGVLVPVITAALLGSVEPSRSGVASGTLNTARQTGSVLGVSVFGALTSVGLVPALRIAATISVALAAVCAVLALAVRAETA